MIRDAATNRADLQKPSGELHAQGGGDHEQVMSCEYDMTGLDSFSCDFKNFNLTSHVTDKALRAKIEQGKYVELWKFLPRDKSIMMNNGGRMQIINRDGIIGLKPFKEETKLSGLHKWLMAFCDCDGIYANTNKGRTLQLYRFKQNIKTAAGIFSWHKVNHCDIMLKQHIHENPWRSWGVIYQDARNICIKDRLLSSQGRAELGKKL